MHLVLLPVGIAGCMVTNRNLFRQTGLQKCGKVNNWSLDCGLWVQNSNIPHPNQNSATFWRIFSSNKHVPANRKKGFYTNHNPNKQEVGFNFVWSGSELWSLFKYSKVKVKNQKHKAVDVLFQAFPMVPLSCRSNLAGRYLFGTDCDQDRITWGNPQKWCSDSLPFSMGQLGVRAPYATRRKHRYEANQVWMNTTFISQGPQSSGKLAVETWRVKT